MKPLEYNPDFTLVETIKESGEKSIRLFHCLKNDRLILQRIVPESSPEVYLQIARILHPNLIEIYDAFQYQNRTVVWEEYFDGIPLSMLLEDRCLTVKEAKNYALQVCNGMEALHSIRVIHRDIKPQNILISADGKLKIIDYDASKSYKNNQDSDTSYLGTVGYAAPEQYGISQSDYRTDIFAIGTMINLMLTGEHPAVSLCTGKFKKIVEKCTRVNASQRYQNVIELKKAILLS